MVFSSIIFLAFFLPVLIICYFSVPKRYGSVRNIVLTLFSLLFYACAGIRAIPLILCSVVVDYLVGKAITHSFHPRKILSLGIAIHLSLLFWFKYANFAVDSLNHFGLSISPPHVVLPVGISFFTFQGISYLVDVYRTDVPVETSFTRMTLYITLFPQLIAGPIVRYRDLAEEIRSRNETIDGICAGAVRFLWGLGKKILLSNSLVQVADNSFSLSASSLSTSTAWLGLLCYSLHIYYDFSGYSDMAIGLGQILGFHFPENFNYPYTAHSITDFWRRWHISLSNWFRDYLYIPLGGSRVGTCHTILNILIVWAATGFWHGAAWTFLFWGFYYGILLTGEKYLWGTVINSTPRIIQHIYALFYILLGWVWFRSDTLTSAISYFAALFGMGDTVFFSFDTIYYIRQFGPELFAGIILSTPLLSKLIKKCTNTLPESITEITKYGGTALIGAFSVCRLLSSTSNPFVYFRF